LLASIPYTPPLYPQNPTLNNQNTATLCTVANAKELAAAVVLGVCPTVLLTSKDDYVLAEQIVVRTHARAWA
jgi:hypothetical protein